MVLVPKALAFLLALIVLPLKAPGESLHAQSHSQDYDEVDPWAGAEPSGAGPESSAVAGFLLSLAGADSVVCQFVAHSIGNNWSGRHGADGAGSLVAEDAGEGARRGPDPAGDGARGSLTPRKLAGASKLVCTPGRRTDARAEPNGTSSAAAAGSPAE